MKICIFAGHSRISINKIDEKIHAIINEILKTDTSFIFYTGNMGEFDRQCSSAVRTAKREHPDINIKLILVLPYMSNKLNTNKQYYEEHFDGVLIPMELAGLHYKSAIVKRNCWMVDRADFILAGVCRDFGGAYNTLKYAKKLQKEIFNIADEDKLI